MNKLLELVKQITLLDVVALLVAVAMFLCASGSGNPATVDPLPDWINITSNVVCVIIGIFVLNPGTRFIASIFAALNMVASMVTNYKVDGYDYFLQALPFNIVTLVLALVLIYHHYKYVKAK